jgi:high frequency lysogenization protein
VRLNPLAALRPGDVTGQCVALAGLFQAVSQVQACAREGRPADEEALATSLESVLRIDAPDPASVFGGLQRVRPGLVVLLRHLERRMSAALLEQARYAASLMCLERRLHHSPASAAALGDALHELGGDVATHGVDSPWMQHQLAELYVRHVSALGPRIMVSGEPAHLKDDDNANRIRALLLAGLRAAVLWRQCDGNRLKLVLFRRRLAREARRLAEPGP